MAESETALQAFDYTVLPANMCTVIRANTEEFTLHMNRSVQEYGQACVNVMNVHAALADRYSGRWAQWCQSVGLSIRSATRSRRRSIRYFRGISRRIRSIRNFWPS